MVAGISEIITPGIFECLYNMGHLDTLAIVDANYCGDVLGKRVIRLPITKNNELLYEILKLIPLDEDNEKEEYVFKPDHCDTEIPQIWDDYKKAISNYYEDIVLKPIDRDEFNKRTKESYVTICTQDKRLYANIIIHKGVVLG